MLFLLKRIWYNYWQGASKSLMVQIFSLAIRMAQHEEKYFSDGRKIYFILFLFSHTISRPNTSFLHTRLPPFNYLFMFTIYPLYLHETTQVLARLVQRKR